MCFVFARYYYSTIQVFLLLCVLAVHQLLRTGRSMSWVTDGTSSFSLFRTWGWSDDKNHAATIAGRQENGGSRETLWSERARRLLLGGRGTMVSVGRVFRQPPNNQTIKQQSNGKESKGRQRKGKERKAEQRDATQHEAKQQQTTTTNNDKQPTSRKGALVVQQ